MAATGAPDDRVTAVEYPDSVGIGSYRIDLHPSSGGDNYVDVASLPFQIPLGALIPVRVQNLVPACKNIGTTHVTNGCYRLHPVERNVGEAAGALLAFALERRTHPHAVRDTPALLADFQRRLEAQGGGAALAGESGRKRHVTQCGPKHPPASPAPPGAESV